MDIKTLQDMPPWDWPENAGEKFQKILADCRVSESDRIIAADLAGNLVVMNDKIADSLLAVVRNPAEPEGLRAMAAISFGPVLELAFTDEFDDPDEIPITERKFHIVKDTLRKLYLDQSLSKELLRRIFVASVRAPEKWHEDEIRSAYSSGDRDWKLTAVFSMRQIQGFEDQILEALESADPEIHFEAIQAAGEWGLAPAWDHVVAIVNNPKAEKHLLLAAIEAVACCLALADGRLWPSAGAADAEVMGGVEVLKSVRSARIDLALSTTLAFGGVNACLAFGRAERCA